jgi:hypothetical protein
VFLWLPAVLIYYGVKERSLVGAGMVLVGIVLLAFVGLAYLAGPV